MRKIKRPALRYHGGKWKLAPWIISFFPPHKVYTECYGGGASVLLRKSRAYAEIYNDIDSDVVNLFRVLRCEKDSLRLLELLRLTPFSRYEFNLAYESIDCPVERAVRLIVRSYMGFGSDSHNDVRKTGFRANSNRSGSTPAHDWNKYPECLTDIITRLKGIVIENKSACEVMIQHDGYETLHYVDPPYVHSTRSCRGRMKNGSYKFEMSDDDHFELASVLSKLNGMVVLSGYPSGLYDELYSDWHRIDRQALADGARPRTEVLWLNNSAAKNINGPLFRNMERNSG